MVWSGQKSHLRTWLSSMLDEGIIGMRGCQSCLVIVFQIKVINAADDGMYMLFLEGSLQSSN